MKTNRWRVFTLRYFTCTRKEKNAALLLGSILLMMQVVIWFRYFSSPPDGFRISDKEQQTWEQMRKTEPGAVRKKYANTDSFRVMDDTPFDPNEPNEEGYVKRGLSQRQAAALIRYRNRVGGFYSMEDMEKIRVLPAGLLSKWRPLLVFKKRLIKATESSEGFKKTDDGRDHTAKIHLDINQADSVALMQLPLVGEGRARAIIRYRERLGGYHDIAQLGEIRIMPDSVISLITSLLHTGAGVYRKIEINRSDSINHPYLTKQMSKLMVSYRLQHGFFSSPEELLKIPLFDEQIIRKLAPYLKFD